MKKLVFNSVYKCYNEKDVIRNFSAEITEGNPICFFGESGCGNTGLYRVQRTIPGCCMDYIVTVVG